MGKRSRSSLGSTPITCWSVMHWALTPRGMPCPQGKKTTGTFRPLEHGFKEGMWDTKISALGGWATVSVLFLRRKLICLQNPDSGQLYLPVLLLTPPDAFHRQRVYAHRVACDSSVSYGSFGPYAHKSLHPVLSLLLTGQYYRASAATECALVASPGLDSTSAD